MRKRRIWMTTPVCYGMAVMLFMMSALSWKFNKYLFAVEMSISIVLLLLISVLGTAGTYAAPPSFYRCYDIMGNGASQRKLFQIFTKSLIFLYRSGKKSSIGIRNS